MPVSLTHTCYLYRSHRVVDSGRWPKCMASHGFMRSTPGAEASTARTVLEDLFAQERSAWNEETLAARICMDKVTLQAR